MGNQKFRLSDMIPNAWFYKLRDMSKTRNSKSTKKKPSSFSTTLSKKPHLSESKQPYYQSMESPKSSCKIQTQPRSFRVSDIDDLFPDLPRKSSFLKKSRRKTIYKPSPKRMVTSFTSNDSKSNSSFPPPLHHQDSLDQSSSESSFDIDFLIKSPSTEFASESSPCSCAFNCSAADIIIDVKDRTFVKSNDRLDAFDRIPVLDLPPIFTKSRRFNDNPDDKATNFSLVSPQLQEIESLDDSLSIKFLKEESDRAKKGMMMMKTSTNKRSARKSASPPAGIKLRTNSPRISSKKNHVQKRMNSSNKKEGLSDSFAVVKSSVDPERDFKESMMEMILENNIRASKDLEDLLACYLTLNSNEYHELIIKAFEQIWFNVPHLHL